MTDSSFLGKGDFVYRNKEALLIKESQNSFLINSYGQRIIDLEASNGTSVLGYNNEILEEAIGSINNLHGSPCFVETEIRLKYASALNNEIKKLTNLEGKISFENSGAGGIELAIRMARKNGYDGPIIVLSGGYHGRTAFTGQLGSSSRYRDFNIPNPNLIRIPTLLTAFEADSYINDDDHNLNYRNNNEQLLKETISWLTSEIEGFSIGTKFPENGIFIFEGIQNVSGMRPLDTAYLNGLISFLKENNTCIIADEVFTGLFRTGELFYTTKLKTPPDLIVFSKGLTNGLLPLSVVWGKNELTNIISFPPGTYSSTHLNYDFGFTVATIVLNKLKSRIKQGKILSNLSNSIEYSWNNDAFVGCKSIYLCGNVARISLKEPVAKNIFKRLLPELNGSYGKDQIGILVATTGLTNNAINIHPPFNIDYDSLNLAFNHISCAINEEC